MQYLPPDAHPRCRAAPSSPKASVVVCHERRQEDVPCLDAADPTQPHLLHQPVLQRPVGLLQQHCITVEGDRLVGKSLHETIFAVCKRFNPGLQSVTIKLFLGISLSNQIFSIHRFLACVNHEFFRLLTQWRQLWKKFTMMH